MNKRCVLTLLLAAAAGAFSNVPAQTVWRCGADGRSFSDRPCSDGRPLQMAALADRRSADEVAAAQAVVAREQRLAEALHRERLQRERQATLADDRPAPPTGGSDGIKPKREAKVQPQEAPRPPRPRSQAPSRRPASSQPAAADGIWQAVAPAFRHRQD